MRTLVAIPVYNEERYVQGVLRRVLLHAGNVLVVDDGSTDRTPQLVADFPVDSIHHAVNLGYGRSLRDAFRWAIEHSYDWLITMDCDEQHEPEAIPEFLAIASSTPADIISGSRYLAPDDADAPQDRRQINHLITAELNARLADRLGTTLTDAFCGFKAYRVSALKALRPTVNGYAFPMQLWVQAAAAHLRVVELPVKRIYVDPSRTFGGHLDDPTSRLAHYRHVLHREIRRRARCLPAASALP